MSTVADTIEALGGDAALAERLGVARSSPRNWRMFGRFPAYLYPDILVLAAEAKHELDGELFHFQRKTHRAQVRKPRETENGKAAEEC